MFKFTRQDRQELANFGKVLASIVAVLVIGCLCAPFGTGSMVCDALDYIWGC